MNTSFKIGAIVAPICVSGIVVTSFRLTMGIFGGCFLVTVLFLAVLKKETSNKPMQDSFTTDENDNENGTKQLTSTLSNPNKIA